MNDNDDRREYLAMRIRSARTPIEEIFRAAEARSPTSKPKPSRLRQFVRALRGGKRTSRE